MRYALVAASVERSSLHLLCRIGLRVLTSEKIRGAAGLCDSTLFPSIEQPVSFLMCLRQMHNGGTYAGNSLEEMVMHRKNLKLTAESFLLSQIATVAPTTASAAGEKSNGAMERSRYTVTFPDSVPE